MFVMNTAKYVWTEHSREKMRHYRLTESRVKRIIRHPMRIEEGVMNGAVACMQPAGGSKYSEIWTMYIVSSDTASEKLRPAPPRQDSSRVGLALSSQRSENLGRSASQRFQKQYPHLGSIMKEEKRIKVITAWRYPGKSPARDPVPMEILEEIKNILS